MIPLTDKPSDHNCYGFVYKATNCTNKKVYIGITIRSIKERIYLHLTKSRQDDPRWSFPRAIKKYGIENFKFEIIEKCYSKEELMERERVNIQVYQSFSPKKGYNLTFGGEFCGSPTPETRKKMSMSAKTRIVDPESYRKRGEKRRGCVVSAETGKNISLAKMGHKTTMTTKNKISKSKWGKKSPESGVKKDVQQLDQSGNVINEFSSVPEASRVSGVPRGAIYRVCQKKQKLAGGFFWLYKAKETK